MLIAVSTWVSRDLQERLTEMVLGLVWYAMSSRVACCCSSIFRTWSAPCVQVHSRHCIALYA